jgi:C4-dicarboxylate-specific signal transduction histidine kinase
MFERSLSLDRPGWDLSGPLPRYTLSFLAVLVAGFGSAVLDYASPGTHNLFLFFAAIAISALYAGAGPGWFSVALSAFAADYFFLPPLYHIEFGAEEISWLVAFVACGVATSAVSLRRRRMEETLRRTRDDLEDRMHARTLELRQLNVKLIEEMTERIRAEKALRQTQCELARASRIMTVAELTASIAHEINQPLAAVVSNGEAAQNWLRRSPPAIQEVTESVAAVVTAGVRSAEIITRIRRLITKAIPRQTTIEVNELVGQVLTLAHSDLTRRGIAIECRLAPALPPVTGDRVQLQQVLLNLVNNASDAMAEVLDRPRELIVETRACDEDTVSIVVTDSGHGLCIADTSRIFQPFYSTKQDGMGIGLSVCRTVIEAHGGSIRATKRQPYGAVLEVDLPAGKNA